MQDIQQETLNECIRAEQSASVVLWEIDLTEVGGERYFFCNEQNEKGEPVTWQGRQYQAYPIQGSGFEMNGKGSAARPTLTVSNLHGMITGMAEDLQSLVGGTVVRRKVYARFLDAVNFVNGNSEADPEQEVIRGRYAYGMFWQYQNNERAIHSIMMSNKGDDLRSVFYVDGAAFPVFAFIEDGLSISAPGADLVVNDTTYKFGATNPATECIAADVILDFKSGRGFYESHSLIVNDNLSCKKLFATDEIVARGGNQIRMNRWGVWCIMA
ncbi:hypothetical protein VEE44_23150 [Escherichia coli]|nr:hypothetical protein VEE44_23150 [Escherichia coli]